jgi:hypothetical protein
VNGSRFFVSGSRFFKKDRPETPTINQYVGDFGWRRGPSSLDLNLINTYY